MANHGFLPRWARIPRSALIENLEALRAKVCCYSGPRCDCKYGVTGGEATGCPELREAIRELGAIENPSILDAVVEVKRLEGLIKRAAKQLQEGLSNG